MNVKKIIIVHKFVRTKLDHFIANAGVAIFYKLMENNVKMLMNVLMTMLVVTIPV